MEMRLRICKLFFCCLILFGSFQSILAQIGKGNGDGTLYSSPLKRGVSPVMLDSMYRFINSYNTNVRGLVLIKNGFIVSESYAYPFYKDIVFDLHSGTKRVMAILVGIAIQEGFIISEDQLVTEFIPPSDINNPDPRWSQLTIEHLLTMSSGFDHTFRLTNIQTMKEGFSKIPFVARPGESYFYKDYDSQLLVNVLEQATKMSVVEFAEKYLFEPLGIADFEWYKIREDYKGASGLRLKVMDMAKIGLLLCYEGKWQNEQVIDSLYFVRGTVTPKNSHFSYFGWQTEARESFLVGHNGQYIYCNTKFDLAFALTSNTPDTLRKAFIEELHSRFLTNLDTVPGNDSTIFVRKLKADLLPKSEVPQWVKDVNGKTLKGKMNGTAVNAVIVVEADSSITVSIKPQMGKQEITIAAGNGTKKYARSLNLDVDVKEDQEYAYMNLASYYQNKSGKISIKSNDVYIYNNYTTQITQAGDKINIKMSHEKSGVMIDALFTSVER